MKKLTALSVSLVAVAALAGTASAQSTVRIAGSTAFRGPATAALLDYLNGIKGSRTLHAAYDKSSSSLLGANSVLLADGTIGTGTSSDASTIIEAGWTGSASGVVDIVARNASGYYLDPTTIGSTDLATFNGSTVSLGSHNNTGLTTAGQVGYGGGAKLTVTDVTVGGSGNNAGQPHQGAPGTLASIPDFEFSDVSAATISAVIASADPISASHPVGTYTSLKQLASDIATIPADGGLSGGASVTAKTVGVVPFQWAVGKITTAGNTDGVVIPSNINQQTALTLISVGQVSQSFFTGTNNAADVNNQFYLIGRNEDSGTRIDSFAEAQFSPAGGPLQYFATASGTALGSVAPYGATPLNTEPNISWNSHGDGHTGYVGGGQVGGALSLNALGSAGAANTYLIGYLGVADAAQKVVGGTLLSYNGVPFSILAVQNGSYSFWSYEHIYVNPAHVSSAAQTVLNGLADEIYTFDADIDANGWHTDPTNANPDTLSTGGKAVSGGVLATKLQVSRLSTSPIGFNEGGPLSHN